MFANIVIDKCRDSSVVESAVWPSASLSSYTRVRDEYQECSAGDRAIQAARRQFTCALNDGFSSPILCLSTKLRKFRMCQ